VSFRVRARVLRTAAIAAVLSSFSGAAQGATLLHTNDVLGDIEPCGCRTNPLGGMARKANLMKRLHDSSILQLDAGDLLFSANTIPDLLSKQAELQAGYLLRSMDALHHDAIVPGEKDFALGLKIFEKLRSRTKIRFIAANLVARSGERLFDKSVIFTRKGSDGKPIRIAVVGIVGDDLPLPRELKVQPPLAAAQKEVAAVRKNADLVVLLTHEGLDKDKELAEKVRGVDIIVGGHTQSFLQEPLRIGKVTIYQSSFRNQYVGVLPLEKPFNGQGYKLIGLDAGYDSPADAPSPTDTLVQEFKKAVGDLNTREDAKLEQLAPPNAASGKFQTFPKCAECHLKQFDFWRKTPHALALNALMEKQQFKNKECLSCHTVGLGDPHGLLSINRLADYKKAPAHTSPPEGESPNEDSPLPVDDPVIEALSAEDLARYLKAMHEAKSLKDQVKITQIEPAETLRRSLSSMAHSWTPVQCENCHLPGQDHPFSGTYSKKVEKTACLNCHTAERAPEWYTKAGKPDWEKIQAKRALVTCPAGDSNDIE
jgi:hypothetical protein